MQVKQISDNEIYLLIKYIKSVLWRVAKRLSCIQDARCLEVKSAAFVLATSLTLVAFIFVFGYLLINWVPNAFLLDVTDITTFLPVRIHYIPNRNSLPILFFMIWKSLLSFKLFIAFRSYVQSSSSFLPNLISAFLVWFSRLHFILYARIPKCLYSVLFLIVNIFLSEFFS